MHRNKHVVKTGVSAYYFPVILFFLKHMFKAILLGADNRKNYNFETTDLARKLGKKSLQEVVVVRSRTS